MVCSRIRSKFSADIERAAFYFKKRKEMEGIEHETHFQCTNFRLWKKKEI